MSKMYCHLKHIIRSIEEKGRAVFGCPAKAGILIQDGHYDLMGDAFTCSEEDLDRIYQAYEDAKSRYEYYGDNGDQVIESAEMTVRTSSFTLNLISMPAKTKP
jgi:hypothetical protein